MRELIAELREHWDDGYWWADRQLLLAVLAAAAAGLIGLACKWGELALAAHYAGKGGTDVS